MRPTLMIAAASGLLAMLACQVIGFPPTPHDSPDPDIRVETGIYEPPEKEIKPLMTFLGYESHITEPRTVRITTDEEWEKLWQDHAGAASRPYWDNRYDHLRLNFNQVMIIAVFRGESSDFPYAVDSVVETRNRICVREAGWQGGNPLSAENRKTRQPWGIVVLPRSNKEVVLQHNMEGTIASPPKWKDVQTFPTLAIPEHLTPEHLHGGIGP